MEIILLQDVDSLGLAGQILNVAPGYGRNFLLPSGKALLASPANLKAHAKKMAEFEARAKLEKEQAMELKEKLAKLQLTLARKAGEKDKLYGAVTAMDIIEAASQAGFELDRKKLRLGEPIKSLGAFSVTYRLHPEITESIQVVVVAEE